MRRASAGTSEGHISHISYGNILVVATRASAGTSEGHVYMHVQRHGCVHQHMNDTRMDTCVDMRMVVHMDLCVDMCVDARMDMCGYM